MWPADSREASLLLFPGPNGGVSFTLSISDDKAEVVPIQITCFRKQGFCISVLTSPVVIDGETAKTMFCRGSWAYFCKQTNSDANNKT
ncbi:hypothetical protein CUMW_220900 [Citrus unshiu]|uniref:Uncharacterized protein n=1 Tax=Citrus unshiu TaxID=55188 RepID=A0A2H5QE21_CITUN|nr:hypothetical protein CUMW_220900 [Citrus unshiu]